MVKRLRHLSRQQQLLALEQPALAPEMIGVARRALGGVGHRHLAMIAAPGEVKSAIAAKGTLVDLRTPEEIAEVPGPAGSVVWDFRANPSLPAGTLPEDKSQPLVLF
jgi:hypothetical protein